MQASPLLAEARQDVDEVGRRAPPPAPDQCSWLSQFFFLFINPVLERGVKYGALNQDDLPLLSASQLPARIFADWARRSARDRTPTAHTGLAQAVGEARSTGLFRRILRQSWERFLISGICLLVTNICALCVPIILHSLLDFLSSPVPAGQQWYGYALAAALFAASIGQACTIHQFWWQAAIVCIRSEVILTTAVYAKALSLSNGSRASISRGKLFNHLAIDACRLNENWIFPLLHWNTWSPVLTIGVSLYWLYSLLGWAGLLGSSVMVVLLPASTLLGRRSKRYSESIQARRDVRSKLISEAIAGIQTLKVFGWVEWFASKITTSRDAEMAFMSRKQYIGVVADFVGVLGPIGVMVCAFGAFTWLNPKAALTAPVAFASLAWLDNLKQPLRSMPSAITSFVDASVSLTRLRKLLDAEDADVGCMQHWRAALGRQVSSASSDAGGQANDAVVDVDAALNAAEAYLDGIDDASLLGGGTQPATYPSTTAVTLDPSGTASATSSRQLQTVLRMARWLDVNAMSKSTLPGDDEKEERRSRTDFLYLPPSDPSVTANRDATPRAPLDGTRLGDDTSSDNVAVLLSHASFAWHGKPDDDTAAAASANKLKKTGNREGNTSATTSSVVDEAAANSTTVVLSDISITCRTGTLTLVTGRVGSGKSSLLCGLVGEAERVAGIVRVNGSIAYSGQSPWVLNRTLMDNICFVDEYRADWYHTVVRACGLDVDAASFQKGHDTLIGDAGITLSGGQQQRVALARAVYADAAVCILDDVLSAVDATVGAHIWTECVVKLLVARRKTVIMASHAVHYCARPEVSQVIVLDGNGGFQACGGYAYVAAACPDIITSALMYSTQVPVSSPHILAASVRSPLAGFGEHTSTPGDDQGVAVETAAVSHEAAEHAAASEELRHVQADQAVDGAGTDAAAGVTGKQSTNLDGAEGQARGYVKASHIWKFVRHMGSLPVLITLVMLYGAAQGLTVAGTWWISVWVDDAGNSHDNAWYAIVYGGINAGMAVATLLRTFLVTYGTMKASTWLHNEALHSILHAPASFFATNPAGRIANRFLSDVSTIDNQLAASIRGLAFQVFTLVGVLIVIAVSTPLVLLWVAALSYLYWVQGQRYRISARDMRRLQSTSKSPILSNFAETLRGVPIIRAFGPKAANAFVQRHVQLSAVHMRAWLAYWASNEYISTVLEGIGALIIGAAAFAAVWAHASGSLGTGQVGFVLTYSMQVPSLLMWLVRQFSSVETDAVSIERLVEYAEVVDEEVALNAAGTAPSAPATAEQEAPPSLLALPSQSTPVNPRASNSAGTTVAQSTSSALDVNDVWMRYGDSLPWVLKGLSLRVPPGTKCAMVGRTGAGKSSVMQALLRMYPYQKGRLAVNDQDLGRLSCEDGRRTVSALLQHGFLFSGTIKDNLLGPTVDLADPPRSKIGAAPSGSNESSSTDASSSPGYAPLAGGDADRHCSSMSDADVDAVLLQALSKVDSADTVRALPNGLYESVSEGGGNFSAGEKALLCLARVIVRQSLAGHGSHHHRLLSRGDASQLPSARPGLILCDEPTAQVDASTDAIVHDTLLSAPETVVCICHRLHHVSRFDLVAVIDGGACVELDAPSVLLARPGSAYRRLVQAAQSTSAAARSSIE